MIGLLLNLHARSLRRHLNSENLHELFILLILWVFFIHIKDATYFHHGAHGIVDRLWLDSCQQIKCHYFHGAIGLCHSRRNPLSHTLTRHLYLRLRLWVHPRLKIVELHVESEYSKLKFIIIEAFRKMEQKNLAQFRLKKRHYRDRFSSDLHDFRDNDACTPLS